MAIKNGLLFAKVMHARQRPKKHSFTYSVFYLCFSLAQMPLLASRLLSLERWNLFSFYKKDHGARDGSPLEEWIKKILDQHHLSEANGEIVLVTLPRIIGYVFNPVSFWFCFDQAKNLRAVLSEVCNTFGERHSYLSFNEDRRPIEANEWLESKKIFHVSPFLPVDGHYKFQFSCSEEKLRVQVNYYDSEGLMLATSVIGNRHTLSGLKLLQAFVRFPLVTFKVITLIHTEALRLILKGARYHTKPTPPTIEVTR